MGTAIPTATGIRTSTATDMTEAAALLRISAWMSPVFPTGGFAWSAGLEKAVEAGLVRDADGLEAWLAALLRHGGARNDAVFFAKAWRGAEDRAAIADLSELCLALAPSAERHAETLALGSAFLAAARHWFSDQDALPPTETPWPVATGAVCRLGGASLQPALCLFLQSFVSNQLQAAIRLSVTGQQGAAAILARLEPAIVETAAEAAGGEIGSFASLADIASMRHETQTVRLFLS